LIKTEKKLPPKSSQTLKNLLIGMQIKLVGATPNKKRLNIITKQKLKTDSLKNSNQPQKNLPNHN
jgi:hypothetical protein